MSSVTEGDAYQAPPGVIEELDDPSAAFGGLGREFNEKGLKLEYEGVQPRSRAEVFNRFPQRPRDFLSYRELKIWALARTGDWGATVPVSFFVKVGEDTENFYLYRTRLEPVPNPGMVTPGDWLPEIVIDFDQWIDLRRQAEESLIFDPRDPGDPPLELWAQDSTYAIVLKDRARAPNLAAVRELSMGVWNEAGFPTTGEVWINEMRLSSPLRDAGFASHLALDIEASDVWTTHLAVRSRGALFRQLVENPTFQGDRVINPWVHLQSRPIGTRGLGGRDSRHGDPRQKRSGPPLPRRERHQGGQRCEPAGVRIEKNAYRRGVSETDACRKSCDRPPASMAWKRGLDTSPPARRRSPRRGRRGAWTGTSDMAGPWAVVILGSSPGS